MSGHVAKRAAIAAIFADRGLQNLDKLVGTALLAVFYHDVKGDCFPSISKLAGSLNVKHRQTVHNCLSRLKTRGHVDWETVEGKSSRYAFPKMRTGSPQTYTGVSAQTDSGDEVSVSTLTGASPQTDRGVSPQTALTESTEEGTELSHMRDAHEAYVQLASSLGLPIPTKLTEPRMRAIKKALAEHGAEGWQRALDEIQRSTFLRGDSADTSWRLTLDWLLKPANFVKVIEGNYRGEAKARRVNNNTSAIIDALARRARSCAN